MPTSKILMIDFQKQHALYGAEIQTSIDRVLRSGWYILGPEVERFETDFATYLGSSHCVSVASGTDALYLALKALHVGAGDEVITVPNTAIPTAVAITQTGATPVFCDIDPATGQMDVSLVSSKLSPRTKALIPVHLFGSMVPLEPLLQFGIPVIEDACQAHGATLINKKAGTFGVMGCFSFYPTKNLGGIGDGGAIVTDDPALAQTLRSLRNYGQKTRYICEQKGINSRLDEIQAAILSTKLNYLESWNQRRNTLANLYKSRLGDRCLAVPKDICSAYHLFVIKAKNRDALKARLEKEGIQTNIHYPVPIYLQPGYSEFNTTSNQCPNAEAFCQSILSLPLYPEMDERDVLRVCDVIA